jgi:hypothetical protein
MGIDLLGDHGDERFNAFGWRECMERAIEFGWIPEGSVAPMNFIGEWKGGYFTNDYQMVTNRDARALGEALLRAVAALSAREQDEVQTCKERPDEEDEFAAEHFTAELCCLRRLANYALKGGFVIA